MISQLSDGTGIRIDAEGRWFFRGAEMTRWDIVQLFYRNLVLDDTGRYAIRIGVQICPVEVEDTAYVVRDVRFGPGRTDSAENIDLLLSDDSIEPLDLETFYTGKNNIPYCRIKNGLHKARFSRPAYYRLAEYLISKGVVNTGQKWYE